MNVSLAEFFSESVDDSQTDVLDKQILAQLNGLNKEEKLLCLQLLKDAVQLRNLSAKSE